MVFLLGKSTKFDYFPVELIFCASAVRPQQKNAAPIRQFSAQTEGRG